jgi:hypothetical protein
VIDMMCCAVLCSALLYRGGPVETLYNTTFLATNSPPSLYQQLGLPASLASQGQELRLCAGRGGKGPLLPPASSQPNLTIAPFWIADSASTLAAALDGLSTYAGMDVWAVSEMWWIHAGIPGAGARVSAPMHDACSDAVISTQPGTA